VSHHIGHLISTVVAVTFENLALIEGGGREGVKKWNLDITERT
jgi:hypothetical protein